MTAAKRLPQISHESPARPLTWSDPATRDHVVLPAWRRALYRSPAGSRPATLKVAVEIAALAGRDGRATASNGTIAERAGIDADRVKDALAELERAGLITRRAVPRTTDNRTGRIIAVAMPAELEGGGRSPPLEGGEGGGCVPLRGVTIAPPNSINNTPQLPDPWVTAEARRLNRATAIARRQLEDAVLAGDDEGEARAKARLIRAHGLGLGGDQ